MNLKPLINQLLSYFLQGVLLVVPSVATIYVLYQLFVVLDSLIPFELFPGAGILIIVTLLTLLGVLGSTIIIQPFSSVFKSFLDRAPLVKVIYDAIKDLVSAFVGKKKSFNTPVLVQMSKDATVQKLGFITSENLEALGIEGKVAVYLPHSYAFSGNLFVVDASLVTPINAKSSDVMKFIVSGGVAQRELEEEIKNSTGE